MEQEVKKNAWNFVIIRFLYGGGEEEGEAKMDPDFQFFPLLRRKVASYIRVYRTNN